ncbi:hypothetical protein [Paraburkholderia sp. 2C]|jgi:hypothetical protein
MSGSVQRCTAIVGNALRANTERDVTPFHAFEERTMEQHIKPVFESGEDSFPVRKQSASEHDDWLIDQALMDTFPASDPISLCAID